MKNSPILKYALGLLVLSGTSLPLASVAAVWDYDSVKSVEQPAADHRLAPGHGRAEVRVADGQDGEVERQRDVEPRRRLEQQAEIRRHRAWTMASATRVVHSWDRHPPARAASQESLKRARYFRSRSASLTEARPLRETANSARPAAESGTR